MHLSAQIQQVARCGRYNSEQVCHAVLTSRALPMVAGLVAVRVLGVQVASTMSVTSARWLTVSSGAHLTPALSPSSQWMPTTDVRGCGASALGLPGSAVHQLSAVVHARRQAPCARVAE